MLSEGFIATSSAPPKATSANHALLKDAGIFQHTFQPEPALRHTFKHSRSDRNCLAINHSHVFSAQNDKALVHIYDREKGSSSIEATIPFSERIHSLAITTDGTILALGAEGGSITLWEIGTGRLVSSPASHLHPVTSLAIDSRDAFVLSGSSDSNVQVWSLLELLSFPSEDDIVTARVTQPRQTLSGAEGGITELAISESRSTSTNYALVAAGDATVTIWDYTIGERLRTILLASPAISLVIDPAERAFYAGMQNGTIQVVDFYAISSVESVYNSSSTPYQPKDADQLLPPPNTQHGFVNAVALSYDSTILVSAHESGSIISWDIASRTFMATLAEYPGAPITNLQFLPPTGWPTFIPPVLKVTPVKPKPHAKFSSTTGRITDDYVLSAQFTTDLDQDPQDPDQPAALSDFQKALAHPIFPEDQLSASIADLLSWSAGRDPVSKKDDNLSAANDFVALNNAPAESTAQERIAALEAQVEHLKKMQRISAKQVEQLTKEKAEWKKKAP